MSIDATPKEWDRAVRATKKQIGGDHYKTGIQPLEYAYANNLTPNLTNVVKYVTRKKNNRVQDLRKAIHYIELELEIVYGVNPDGKPID